MASFNKVILRGNLARDPELRYTPSGTAVAGFGIATNRRWKDQDGNQKEEVTYIDITAFGKQAEVIGQYFQKGKGIHIEGRLKFDQWDDKNTGQKRRFVLPFSTIFQEGLKINVGGNWLLGKNFQHNLAIIIFGNKR